MNNHPETLNPPAANSTVDGDAASTDTESVRQNAEMARPGDPPPKRKGWVMESIRSLVDDFVDYTKKTEL
jgi:hypothetical protein